MDSLTTGWGGFFGGERAGTVGRDGATITVRR